MDIFCKEVCDFLNTLDECLPSLLCENSLHLLNSNPIGGVHFVVLHNNEYAILNRIAFMIAKRHVATLTDTSTKQKIICREHLFEPNTPDTGSFISSDYHFEFELTETSLQYIKKLIKNKPIFSSEFVFIIKNASMSINRTLYLELRRLIDTSNIARWIITMERHTFLDKSVQSRALMINCCFPLLHIVRSCRLPLTIEEYYPVFMKSKGNVITFLQLISTTNQSMLWQDTFDKFIVGLQQEKKQLIVIMTTREIVYKLYHIGVSFTEFCRYIIIKYGKDIADIITLIAECEHEVSVSKSKECLMYEKIILELYKQFNKLKHVKKESKPRKRTQVKQNNKIIL
jgi:hypothetical protein